jgi:hypothetical protein
MLIRPCPSQCGVLSSSPHPYRGVRTRTDMSTLSSEDELRTVEDKMQNDWQLEKPPRAHTARPKIPRTAQMPPKNHKRIGRVQLGIRRAFIVAPDRLWSTSQLMEWTHALALYRGRSSHRERHYYCKDVRRAAERLCDRVGRSATGSGRAVLWRLKTFQRS